MNDVYKPRIDAFHFFKDHPISVLKSIYNIIELPIDIKKELEKSRGLLKCLIYAGAIRIEVLNDDPEPSQVVDEIFITVPDPLPKTLLVEIVELHPDEFDEIEPNVFRLWWD